MQDVTATPGFGAKYVCYKNGNQELAWLTIYAKKLKVKKAMGGQWADRSWEDDHGKVSPKEDG